MEEFLKRVEAHSLKDDDYETIKGMAHTITFLSDAVQQKKGSIGRFTGGAPFQATVYEIQKLRCNLCGQIYKPEVKAKKYDETARAMIPLLKYGSGPLMQGLQT